MIKRKRLLRKIAIRIKRWWQYYTNGEIFDTQFGDYYMFTDPITVFVIDEFQKLCLELVATICAEDKCQPISTVSFIVTDASPGDTLAQRGTIAWKINVRVHNRKSWSIYESQLLAKQIKFTQKRR